MSGRSGGFSRTSSALRTWPRDEAMREVGVDRQGLADPELLHHDETQTIHQAVRLIGMTLEVLECCVLFVGRRSVDRGDFFPVQLVAQARRLLVADLARQRDRLRDDVIGRHEMVA